MVAIQEIRLQELVDQVRKELLAPSNSPDPIFFIDKIELELAVKVVKDAQGGVKVTVIGIAEGSLGASVGGEQGHVVRVSLSPLLSREAILNELIKDPKKEEYLMKYMKRAFLKGDDTAGAI